MTERRSATERHYLLADGTYKAEVHLQPIHYKAPDGTWQPIDTALDASAKLGFAVSNEKNTLKAYLPATADGWLRVEAGGCALSFRLSSALPAPAAVQGDGVRFETARSGVRIDYAVQPGRLKEMITLTSPLQAPTFRYLLQTEGMTPTLGPDHSLCFTNAAGETAMVIATPWMRDAAGRNGRVAVSLQSGADGLEYVLAPDSEWLASARYPVTIDPTITAALTWTAVDAIDDYYLDSFWSQGICDETWPPDTGDYLAVGAPYAAAAYRSLLCFSVPLLPLDSEIQSATLSLHADHSTGDPNMQVDIYEVDKNLSPTGTSSQYPTPNNTGITSDDLSRFPMTRYPLEPNFYDDTKSFDVTGLVQYWADGRGSPLKFLLRDVEENKPDRQDRSSAVVFFIAEDSALSVIYTTPGWYMLQGNNRHLGRTQYPLTYSIDTFPTTAKWSASLPTPSPGTMPSPIGGAELQPSGVAVPNADSPESPYPVLYVPVKQQRYYPPSGSPTGSSRLWRIDDTGLGHEDSYVDLPGIIVTGAPIVVLGTLEDGVTPCHKVVVTGYRKVDSGNGVWSWEAHVIRFDVSKTGSPPIVTFSEKWDYVFSTSTIPPYDTPKVAVFASPAYWYGTTEYDNEYGPQSYTGGVVLVPAARPDPNTGDSHWYLFALALDTMDETLAGTPVWGVVDSSVGDLVFNGTWGSLSPLQGLCTQESSPAVSGVSGRTYLSTWYADMSGSTGVVEARSLSSGASVSPDPYTSFGGPEAAHDVSVLGNRFFFSKIDYLEGWLDMPGMGFTGESNVPAPAQTGSMSSPPAIFARDHTAVSVCASATPPFGCTPFGVATDSIAYFSPVTSPKWTGDTATGGYTISAPVVAGYTSAISTFACIPAANASGNGTTNIYRLLAPNQGQWARDTGVLPAMGLSWSNMAAFGSPTTGHSRLYVFAGGINAVPYNPMTVYCFAQ